MLVLSHSRTTFEAGSGREAPFVEMFRLYLVMLLLNS